MSWAGVPYDPSSARLSFKSQAALGVCDHLNQSIRDIVLPWELGRADSQVQATIAQWLGPSPGAIFYGIDGGRDRLRPRCRSPETRNES